MTEQDRLAALLSAALPVAWDEARTSHVAQSDLFTVALCGRLAALLIAAGVTLTPDALREAAQAVMRNATPDDDFDGAFVDYLVPYLALDALRAALRETP